MQLSKKTLFQKWKRDNDEEVEEMVERMKREGLNADDRVQPRLYLQHPSRIGTKTSGKNMIVHCENQPLKKLTEISVESIEKRLGRGRREVEEVHVFLVGDTVGMTDVSELFREIGAEKFSVDLLTVDFDFIAVCVEEKNPEFGSVTKLIVVVDIQFYDEGCRVDLEWYVRNLIAELSYDEGSEKFVDDIVAESRMLLKDAGFVFKKVEDGDRG